MKMMDIHVDRIEAGGLDLRFEETPQDFPELAEMIKRGDCKFVAPIKASLRVIRIADRFEVKGDVQTAVRLPCGRCLKAVETSLKSHFTLTYTARPEEMESFSEQNEIELRTEQINRIYFQGEKINLRDAIQEQVIMAFPIRVLCSKTCKGLCPQCGADLNAGDCGCYSRSSDSKFAVLKNFRPKKT
jgi:uncharacterized protein